MHADPEMTLESTGLDFTRHSWRWRASEVLNMASELATSRYSAKQSEASWNNAAALFQTELRRRTAQALTGRNKRCQ